MAEQAHVCSHITILAVVTIEFASEAEPLKEVSRSTRTASAIPLRCACTAGNVARLAIVVCVGPEAGIALVLARAFLQLHNNLVHIISNGVRTLVALGARGIQRSRALKAFFRALRATLVDHIGEHVIRTVIDAGRPLQEEAALTFLTFCDQSTIAFRAIRMALNAHRELIK